MKSYILFNKPYGMLSQFTREAGHTSLADCGPFAPGIYPAGRLDADSEGLLLLTDDTTVRHRLTDPKFGHERTYLVQVEGIPDSNDLRALESGVMIERARTRNAHARLLEGIPDLPPRPVPVRFRKNVPTAWLEIILREGRNRQVRKMTAAIGYPTLRIVRTRIAFLSLAGLQPGQYRELTVDEINTLRDMLHIQEPDPLHKKSIRLENTRFGNKKPRRTTKRRG